MQEVIEGVKNKGNWCIDNEALEYTEWIAQYARVKHTLSIQGCENLTMSHAPVSVLIAM